MIKVPGVVTSSNGELQSIVTFCVDPDGVVVTTTVSVVVSVVESVQKIIRFNQNRIKLDLKIFINKLSPVFMI